MQTDLIFVYGLLKSIYENEPARFIRKNCELFSTGSFTGRLYDVGTYPGAVYDHKANTMVYGEVYKIIQNKEKLIAFLDHFEGVGPGFESPNEYRKQIIPVHTKEGMVEAVCYVYNWNSNRLKVIESGRYENKDGTRN